MQTSDLMDKALAAEPFECKDIEIALHEIRQMQKDIEKLQSETNERTNIIQNLIGKDIIETKFVDVISRFSFKIM